METNQDYPNWPAKGEIPKMGVPRKLTDKELKIIDEMMDDHNSNASRFKEVFDSICKDAIQVICLDQYVPRVTFIKIPRKLKKQMKKEGSWNNPVITFSGEVTDYGISVDDKTFHYGQ